MRSTASRRQATLVQRPRGAETALLRFVLLAILIVMIARVFWRVIDGVMEAAGGASSRDRGRSPAVKLVRDPVCGTYVAPGAALSLTSGGSTHYFCSEQCRATFQGRS